MKKINWIILLFILLLPATCLAEKIYLYEDLYYGMSFEEAQHIIKTGKIENNSAYGIETITIENYNFTPILTFNKKNKLIKVSLAFKIYSEKKDLLSYKIMQYLNSFTHRILYITNNGIYALKIDKTIFDNAIKEGFYIYYCLGKKTYIDAAKNSDKTFSSIVKNIPRNRRIILCYMLKNMLILDFELFKDVYKKENPFYQTVQKLEQQIY